VGEPAEVAGGFIARLGHDRHVQAAADNAGDVPERHTLFGDAVARAGAAESVRALVADLARRSPEFEAMWLDNDVRNCGEGTKHLRHPVVGPIALEYSAFAVDGRPDLGMVVYNPATPGGCREDQVPARAAGSDGGVKFVTSCGGDFGYRCLHVRPGTPASLISVAYIVASWPVRPALLRQNSRPGRSSK
jgi:hypothetical protein